MVNYNTIVTIPIPPSLLRMGVEYDGKFFRTNHPKPGTLLPLLQLHYLVLPL